MLEQPTDTPIEADSALTPEALFPALGKPVISSAALILANCLPIIGVLFFDWDAPTILILYWIENLIIGAFNVLRMAVVPVHGENAGCAKGFLISFFLMHYGLFCMVHGFFVVAIVSFLFLAKGGTLPLDTSPFDFWPMLWYLTARSGSVFPLAVTGLIISHGLSFGLNYLGRGEYRTANIGLLLFSPYGRIVVLHLTILFGACLIAFTGIAQAWLAVMVVMKIIVDLIMHLREREKHRLARSAN